MLLRKKQSEQAKKRASSPFEEDIPGMADYLIGQGKPLHLLLRVDDKIFQEHGKGELEPMLRQYGEILSNYDFSHYLRLKLDGLESTRRIVEAYKSGKLEGIVGMELSSMDAVLCGGLGIGYR